ncbi:glycosyltransferase family 39 protein [bacterium]|nr:glycosyltransferase family 39 protein [bacterium]
MKFVHNFKWKNTWLPSVFILTGICIRLINYFRVDFWYDEALQIYECYTFGINQYEALIMHPPLNNMFLYFWLEISNSSAWIKLLPVIWGTGTLILVYFITLKLFNRTAALWSLAVMVVLPFHVYYSRDTRVYSLQTFLVMFSWFAFLKLEEHRNSKWFLILMGSAALGLYSHYFTIFPMAALGICSLFLLLKDRKMVLAASSLSLSVILYIPWLFKLFQATEIMMKDSQFFPPQLTVKYMARMCVLLIGGYHGRVCLSLVATVTIFGLLGFVLLVSDFRRRVLISGLIILPLLLIYSVGVVMHYNYLIVRYIMFITPAIAIVAGAGISKFQGKLTLIPGMLIVLPSLVGIFYVYNDDFNGLELDQGVRPRKEYSEPADLIADNWQETDIVTHSCVSSYPSMYYYLTVKKGIYAGNVIDLSSQYGNWFRSTWNVGNYIDYYPWAQPVNYPDILKDHDRMWFIASEFDINAYGTFDTDFMYFLREHLLARYALLDYQYYYGCPVYLLDLKAEKTQS